MRNIKRFYTALVAASAIAMLGGSHNQVLAQAPDPAGPRASSIVHGLFFDANLKQLKPSPEIILQLQENYLSKVESGISASDRAVLAKRRQANVAMSESDRVWANTAVILTSAAKLPADAAVTLRSNGIMLLSKYAALTGQPFDPDVIVTGKLPPWIKKLSGIDPAVLIDALKFIGRGNYAYSKLCAANNVPVPPTWRGQAGGGGWVPVTPDLAINYLTQPGQFPHSKSQIFSYTPTSGPQGLCLALPIIQDTVGNAGNFNALGIICQGLAAPGKTSHACFWDNAVDNIPINQIAAISGSFFKSPPNLPNDNQCTDCHAGENAFITHPGSAIDIAKNNFNSTHPTNFISQNNWYTPLVQPTWPQNPENEVYMSGSGNICGDCHNPSFAGRLPDVEPSATGLMKGLPPRDNLYKYCYFLLPNILSNSGDPAFTPGTMAAQVATHAADVTSLYNSCKNLFPYFPATQADWLKPRNPP